MALVDVLRRPEAVEAVVEDDEDEPAVNVRGMLAVGWTERQCLKLEIDFDHLKLKSASTSCSKWIR